MVIQQTWVLPPQPATLRVRDFKPRKYDCGPCLRGPFLMSRFRWALNALGWFTETRRYHAYCYHWRRIGRCNGGASLDQAWRGCDLGEYAIPPIRNMRRYPRSASKRQPKPSNRPRSW